MTAPALQARGLHVALGQPAWPLAYWLSPLSGLLLWAPLFLLLDALRLGGWRRR